MTGPNPISLIEFVEFSVFAIVHRSGQIAMVFCGTLIALAALNVVAPRLELIDHNNGSRKWHGDPIALTGGFAILCGAWIGTFAQLDPTTSAPVILALLGIVCAVHAFDDRVNVYIAGINHVFAWQQLLTSERIVNK